MSSYFCWVKGSPSDPGVPVVIAVGADGVIVRSTDKGKQWQPVKSGTTNDLTSICTTKNGDLIAVGLFGTVLLSKNGGLTWQPQTTSSASNFYSITATPNGNIFVAGAAGQILRFDGGGWEKAETPGKDSLRSIISLSINRLVAVGNNGVIWLSVDSGKKWTAKVSGTTFDLQFIKQLSTGKLIVVGDGGTVLHSSDQGETWGAHTNVHEYGESELLSLSKDYIAQGARAGYLRFSTDNGESWHAKKIASKNVALRQFLKLPNQQFLTWVIDEPVLLSTDFGETWHVQSAALSALSNAIILANGDVLGVNMHSQIVISKDHGKSWQATTTRVRKSFSNTFVELANRSIVTVGTDILVSQDAGKTWQIRIEYKDVSSIVTGVASAINGNVVAVGFNGKIILSKDNGSSWQPKTSPNRSWLNTIKTVANGVMLAAGTKGTLILSKDNGETWQATNSTIQADLHAITTTETGRILVSATTGEILFSDDNGDTWQAIHYSRYPARWYWLVLLLLLVSSSYLLLRKTSPNRIAAGLNEQQASDSPILDGSQDRLGHAQIVLGVSAFMRNEDTCMPLTLAVTGAWGLGKSSLMAFLQHELKRQGFRSVWFNPWHYQKEENVLAALLAQVQQEAVPPFLSGAGLRFRAALLLKRAFKRWGISLLVLSVALAGLIAFLKHGEDLQQAIQYIVTPEVIEPAKKEAASGDEKSVASAAAKNAAVSLDASVPPASAPTASASASASAASVTGNVSSSVSTHAKTLGLLDRAAKVIIKTFFPDGETQARTFISALIAFAFAAAAMLPLLIATSRAWQAFSQKASVLAASIDGWFGIKRAQAQTNFRANFAEEFKQVTNALAPTRLVIFIDDLDRCKPDVVMEIMEAINFLSVSGECFIVLGIAPDKVAHAIGMAQKDIAIQLEPGLPPDQACFKYGNMYLRKLVNIEIPLKSLDGANVLHLLRSPKPPEPPAPAKARDDSMRNALGLMHMIFTFPIRGLKLVALLSVPLLAVVGAYNMPNWKIPDRTMPPVIAQVNPGPTSEPTPTPTITPAPQPTPTPTPEPRTIHIRNPGDPTPPPITYPIPALFIALLLAVALRLWLQALREKVQDTPEFEQACDIWSEPVALLFDSPREVKRWINRVRYINARLRLISPSLTYWQRAFETSQTLRNKPWPGALLTSLAKSIRPAPPTIVQALPEAQLVGLTALMSVATKFNQITVLDSQAQSSADCTLLSLTMLLPVQLDPASPWFADYAQVRQQITACMAKMEAQASADPAGNPPANQVPIKAEALRAFLSVAKQFLIVEKPL